MVEKNRGLGEGETSVLSGKKSKKYWVNAHVICCQGLPIIENREGLAGTSGKKIWAGVMSALRGGHDDLLSRNGVPKNRKKKRRTTRMARRNKKTGEWCARAFCP